ncbi:hypothetical protein M758_2G127600 [Ceratodon purpureus]|nr:hypothetical protein M758_2G127600 [Ceratodon purpureus]
MSLCLTKSAPCSCSLSLPLVSSVCAPISIAHFSLPDRIPHCKLLLYSTRTPVSSIVSFHFCLCQPESLPPPTWGFYSDRSSSLSSCHPLSLSWFPSKKLSLRFL